MRHTTLKETVAALSEIPLDEILRQMQSYVEETGIHSYPMFDRTGVLDRLKQKGFRLGTLEGLDTDCFGEETLPVDKQQLSLIADSILVGQREFDEHMEKNYGYNIVWCVFGPNPEDHVETSRQVYLLAERTEPPKTGKAYIGQIWIRFVLPDDPKNCGIVRHRYAIDRYVS